MKHIKLFEEYTAEAATQVTPDSDVTIDDFTSDAGLEIKSTEIVGVITSSESEKEFKDYFYDTYGNGSFTESDMGSLVTYFNEYQEEITAAEVEAEEEAEEGEDELDLEL